MIKEDVNKLKKFTVDQGNFNEELVKLVTTLDAKVVLLQAEVGRLGQANDLLWAKVSSLLPSNRR